MSFNTIIYQEDGPIGTITLNRPDDGNMFTVEMCHEIRDCINAIRRETRTRVIVIAPTGMPRTWSGAIIDERGWTRRSMARCSSLRVNRRTSSSPKVGKSDG